MPETQKEPGTLYVIGTPIGNIEDITLRAIKVMNSVDFIAAEDTRVTAKLLNKYYIHCSLLSYHDRNKEKQVKKIIDLLQGGKSGALLTDAGTPAISDPAYVLLQEALRSGLTVRPIPGVSAVITALSVAGVATDRFTFYGFVPRKKGKREMVLKTIRERGETAVLFEAPHRLVQTLRECEELLPQTLIVLAKEMTKINETFIRGTPTQVLQALAQEKIKGEYTLLIETRATKATERGAPITG